MKMKRKIDSVEDFYMEYGGVAEIGIKLQISPWNIARWKDRGIPQHYWDKITEAYGIGPGELYSLTKKAKNQKAA